MYEGWYRGECGEWWCNSGAIVVGTPRAYQGVKTNTKVGGGQKTAANWFLGRKMMIFVN
jgi:hypothetical protein